MEELWTTMALSAVVPGRYSKRKDDEEYHPSVPQLREFVSLLKESQYRTEVLCLLIRGKGFCSLTHSALKTRHVLRESLGGVCDILFREGLSLFLFEILCLVSS